MAGYLPKPPFPQLNKGLAGSKYIVGAWPMPERYIGTLYDVSGRGHHATIQNGSPVMGDSPYGKALTNTTSDTMVAPNSTDLSFTDGSGNDTKCTILSVFKLTSMTAGSGIILKDGFTAPREWNNWVWTTGYFAFTLYGGTSTNFIATQTDAGTITTNKWYTVISTYDGSESNGGMKIYVNGVRADTSPSSGGSYTGTVNAARDLGLGSYADGNGSIAGQLANAVVWKGRELRGSEIRQLTADPFLMYRKKAYGVAKAPAAPTGHGNLLGTQRNRLVYGG